MVSGLIVALLVLGLVGVVTYLVIKKYFRRKQRKEMDMEMRTSYNPAALQRDVGYEFNFNVDSNTSVGNRKMSS